MNIKYLLIVCFFLFCTQVNAQLFKAGFVAGVSLMQIEGDEMYGFDKIGFSGGVMVDTYIKDNMSVSMEILFSQRGSKSGVAERNIGRDLEIAWNYIEIPVLFNYKDEKGKGTIGGGLSLGRLVSATYYKADIEDPDFYTGDNTPKEWDVSLAVNLGYNIKPFWQAGLRWTYSLTPVLTGLTTDLEERGQYNNVVTLRTIFLFNALGKRKL